MSTPPPEVTQNPRYIEIKARSEFAAAKARDAQANHRKYMSGFIVSSATAAVLGGLILLGVNGVAGDGASAAETATLTTKLLAISESYRSVSGAAQAIALGVAAVCAYMLREVNYGDTWTTNRVAAEEGRGQLYISALEIAHEASPEAFEAAGQYTYQDLVQGQLKYLRDASGRHGKHAGQLAVFGAVVLGFGVVASALSGFGNTALVVIAAFIGVLSPALLAGIRSWQEMNFDRERVKMHDETIAALSLLAEQGTRLTEATKSGDLPGALAYTNEVLRALNINTQKFSELAAAAVKTPAVPGLGGGAAKE